MVEMTIHEFLCSTSAADFPVDISNWEIVKSINEFNQNTKDFFHTISSVHYYLSNPKLLAWVVWGGVVKYSFWICLFIFMFSIIGYLFGIKKGKKYAKISFGIYLIISMFNAALK